MPLPPVESDTDSIADYADGENTGEITPRPLPFLNLRESNSISMHISMHNEEMLLIPIFL